MLNGFDPVSSRFLADLSRIQERSHRAERQIASGLRVEKASDAPEQVAEILRLRSRVETNTQTQTNLARVQAQVNTAEAAMRESVGLLERARVVGAQAATTGAPNRPALAIEVRQLHDRLIAVANVSAEGRYVFGGDGVTGQPYVADTTEPSGARLASGAIANTTLVADDNQTTFQVFRTASQVFDASGPSNAFKALEDLAVALANDSETDVQAAMPALLSALEHVNRELAHFGNAQNRVTSAMDSAKRNAVSIRTELSRLEETDLPTAILELNSAKLHHETALMAHSKMPRSTLFDYLG